MKIELSTLEMQALSAAIVAEAMKMLAPRLDALEKALLQRALPSPDLKVQATSATSPTPFKSAILNRKEIKVLTNLGNTTLWRLEKEGRFPSKVQLSNGRVGWKRDDVMEWIETREAA
jgi:prophage regulatory protein